VIAGILLSGCKQKTQADDMPETGSGKESPMEQESVPTQTTDRRDESSMAQESDAVPETIAPAETLHPDPGKSLRNPATYRPQDRRENFVETDSYYYYLNNGRIYYSEKTEPTFYLLCSKPNCPHGGEDCNAYGGGEGGALGYWDGKLYSAGFVNDELALVRMDLDGSNHELVTKLAVPVAANGTAGGSYSFYFANGYFFYVVNAQPYAFFRVDLSSERTDRLFTDLFADGSGPDGRVLFDGDFFYFDLYTPQGVRWLCQCPCGTEEVRKLCSWPKAEAPRWDVENGTVYYYSKTDGTFYEYSIESMQSTAVSNPQLVNGPARFDSAYYDSNYIYLVIHLKENLRELYIFDRDYTLLQHLALPLFGDYLYAAEDKLFFSNTYSYKISHYLPMSEIGSENAELHPVKDPYALR
jgi:hypothetical protein